MKNYFLLAIVMTLMFGCNSNPSSRQNHRKEIFDIKSVSEAELRDLVQICIGANLTPERFPNGKHCVPLLNKDKARHIFVYFDPTYDPISHIDTNALMNFKRWWNSKNEKLMNILSRCSYINFSIIPSDFNSSTASKDFSGSEKWPLDTLYFKIQWVNYGKNKIFPSKEDNFIHSYQKIRNKCIDGSMRSEMIPFIKTSIQEAEGLKNKNGQQTDLFSALSGFKYGGITKSDTVILLLFSDGIVNLPKSFGINEVNVVEGYQSLGISYNGTFPWPRIIEQYKPEIKPLSIIFVGVSSFSGIRNGVVDLVHRFYRDNTISVLFFD
jgi:hypothetical protein